MLAQSSTQSNCLINNKMKEQEGVDIAGRMSSHPALAVGAQSRFYQKLGRSGKPRRHLDHRALEKLCDLRHPGVAGRGREPGP